MGYVYYATMQCFPLSKHNASYLDHKWYFGVVHPKTFSKRLLAWSRDLQRTIDEQQCFFWRTHHGWVFSSTLTLASMREVFMYLEVFCDLADHNTACYWYDLCWSTTPGENNSSLENPPFVYSLSNCWPLAPKVFECSFVICSNKVSWGFHLCAMILW